jgi:hypothetical protein
MVNKARRVSRDCTEGTDSWNLLHVARYQHQVLISDGSTNVYQIKSKATGEYLYAASDDLARDQFRRRVFTRTNKETSPSSDDNWESKGKHLITN